MTKNCGCKFTEVEIFSFILLLLLLGFVYAFEVKQEIDIGDLFIGLMTVSIAYAAYITQKIQLNTQKIQAITQLNQVFNDINKSIISNPNSNLLQFANKLYAVSGSDHNTSGQSDLPSQAEENNKQLTPGESTPLIFMILNAYEAYYISNKDTFSTNKPLILKNLFEFYPSSQKILEEHSYDCKFVTACKIYLINNASSGAGRTNAKPQ